MRRYAPVALIASIALGLAAPGVTQAATTVSLGDNFFAPSSKTISQGAKVRFKWIGNRRHNVTKRRGPGGAIKSPTTRSRGVNFSKRFNKPGTYRFVCSIHPEEMRLKLTVTG
jgi:plastocyanin